MKHRQMHHSYLNRENLHNFKPIQTLEARTLLRNLVDGAANQYEHFISRCFTFDSDIKARGIKESNYRFSTGDNPTRGRPSYNIG
jgi:hypothetical protein